MVAAMAEPKFFPPDVDTGLENIFGQVFSLHDPTTTRRDGSVPVPVQQPPDQQVQNERAAQSSSQASLVAAALLLLTLVLWSISDVLTVAFPSIRLYVLGAAMLVSGSRAAFRRDSLAIAACVEILALVWIGSQQVTPFYDKLGAGILSMLAMQELTTYA